MKPLLLLALLAAAPALAQGAPADTAPPPGGYAERPAGEVFYRFQSDLSDLTRLATAAALVHERTGAFPASPFALLGSPEARQTGALTFPLSALSVEAVADSVVLRYVPLPVDPYVDDNLVVTASVRPDRAGRYAIRHEMRRQTEGGRPLLYARADGYDVGRGFGRLCVETESARRQIASGAFSADPTSLGGTLTTRLRAPEPGGEVFLEGTSTVAQ